MPMSKIFASDGFSKIHKLCIGGLIIAMYIVAMFVTQNFAFGAVQVRIATALYALSFVFPFLVVPLALANALANYFFGPFGVFDFVGGFVIGVITAGAVALVRRYGLPSWLIIPIIVVAPALVVPIWLSYLLQIPYFTLVVSLLLGQITPAVVGYVLVRALGVVKVK